MHTHAFTCTPSQLFEAINLAALQKLPAIFVCENNKYGMGTSTARGSFDTDYYSRGQYIPGLQVSRYESPREPSNSYSEHASLAPLVQLRVPSSSEPISSEPSSVIPSILSPVPLACSLRGLPECPPCLPSQVDGMNVLCVREAVKVAMKHAQEVGPIVMEMDTYRYHGHSMSDPGITYRSREEVSGVRQSRDPVQTVKNWLLNEAGCTDEEVKALELSVRKEIEIAVEGAKAELPPPASELTRDIHSGKYPAPRMCNLPL